MIGHVSGNNQRAETNAVGIKSNIEHVDILHEMFIRMPNHQNHNKPVMKFIPHGLVHSIGHKAYTTLIKSNNQYLLSVATIPVNGILSEMLEIKINAYNPTTKTTKKMIRNILLDNHWCHGLEQTNDHGKILLLTTRAHLSTGQQWLDDNLPVLFAEHLKNHPEFILDEDYPVAQRTTCKPISANMQTYADAIKNAIPTFATEEKMTKKFAKPPKSTKIQLHLYSFDPDEFPEYTKQEINNKEPTNKKQTAVCKQTGNKQQEQHTQVHHNSTDNDTLKQSIIQEVNHNITQMIAKQLNTELQPLCNEISGLHFKKSNSLIVLTAMWDIRCTRLTLHHLVIV